MGIESMCFLPVVDMLESQGSKQAPKQLNFLESAVDTCRDGIKLNLHNHFRPCLLIFSPRFTIAQLISAFLSSNAISVLQVVIHEFLWFKEWPI